MLFYVIAGAVAVDALASGIWIGHKWGASSVQAALTKAGADAAALQAAVKAEVAKAAPVVKTVEEKVAPAVTDIEAESAAIAAAVKAELAKLFPAGSQAPTAPITTPTFNISLEDGRKPVAPTQAAPSAGIAAALAAQKSSTP